MNHSYLFVPGNQAKKIDKALSGNAHAVIIDLEDSISNNAKDEARTIIRDSFSKRKVLDKEIYFRINGAQSDYWKEDLKLVEEIQCDGVFVPSVQDESNLSVLESITLQKKKIIPIIETARGIENIDSILSAKLIDTFAFGVIDYCLDLNISFDTNNPLIEYARIKLVIAARTYGLAPPIDSIYPYFKDNNGLVEDVLKAKRLGITSKLCIHPSQVDTVNDLLSFNEEELTWAKKVITVFERALEDGIAAVSLEGEMIDYPVYKRALQIGEKWRKLNVR